MMMEKRMLRQGKMSIHLVYHLLLIRVAWVLVPLGERWKYTLDRSLHTHTSDQTNVHVSAGGHNTNMQT